MIARKLLLLLASCWTVLPGSAAHSAERPNVVVFLADDQGWGDLSCRGNLNLSTSHIDSLEADGASCQWFYVCPVCAPTRAEFLTGRYHLRSGVRGVSVGRERMNPDETTLADVFQSAGYATAAFGKWHNGTQYPYHPNARGFKEFYGFCSGHWGHYFSPLLEHNGELTYGEGYLTDDLTGRAIQFIEAHRMEPFLVFLPYNTPHSPMQVPDRWWKDFADKRLVMPHRYAKNEKVGHTRAALAMCENIDWNVGRVLQALDKTNLADNTIVIYFSDNGPNGFRWNGDMRGKKGTTDEGGIRSPMFIRWPGTIAAGRRIEPIAGAIDLLPTLVDLAGLSWQPPQALDGRSLAPLLLEDAAPWPDRNLFTHWGGRVSVRNQRYRLDHEGRLYDMRHDLGQRNDLAGEHPDVARQLRQAVDEWEEEMGVGQPAEDRAFTVGHADAPSTLLPARDATPHGGIRRSSQHPNCSYFINWTSREDRIAWDVEVLEPGDYQVEIFYACAEPNVGSTVELEFAGQRTTAKVDQSHDPPLVGQEDDRFPRTESLVKRFKPLNAGVVALPAVRDELSLRALDVAGEEVMELRLLRLTRVVP